MTKERFFEIAEEVGIASSDWKEDLWKIYQKCSLGLPDHEEEEAALICKWDFQVAKNGPGELTQVAKEIDEEISAASGRETEEIQNALKELRRATRD